MINFERSEILSQNIHVANIFIYNIVSPKFIVDYTIAFLMTLRWENVNMSTDPNKMSTELEAWFL